MTDTPADLGTGRDVKFEWEEFMARVLDRVAALEAGGGGSGLTAASPFTVATMTNPFTGSGEISVLVFPAGHLPALALAMENDEFPRFLLGGNPGDGIWAGDGATDPGDVGAQFTYDTVDGTPVWQMSGIRALGDVECLNPGTGVVLHSPDGTAFRVTVADDGTLSAATF